MRNFLIVPALVLAMATTAGSTFASDDIQASAPRNEWMTIAQVTEKLASEGYDVRRVTEEEGGYELYAFKDGKRIEAHVDPVTGALFQSEVDD